MTTIDELRPYEHGSIPMPKLPETWAYHADGKLILYKAHAPVAVLMLSDLITEKRVHQVGEYDFY